MPARAAIGAEPGPAEPPGWLVGAGYVVAPNPFGADVDAVSTPLPLLGYIGERRTWLGPYLRYEFVDAGSDPAYGRYLAHTVANCHGCHTQRSKPTGAFARHRMRD